MEERIGLGRRFVALFFDCVLKCFGSILVNILIGIELMSLVGDSVTTTSGSISYLLVAVIYNFIEVFAAATPGKMFLGIAVADINGSVATHKQLLIRYVFKNLLYLSLIILVFNPFPGFLDMVGMIIGFLGFIAGMILFLGSLFLILLTEKQAAHDKIAKTAIYRRESIQDLDVDIKRIFLTFVAVTVLLLIVGAVKVFFFTKKAASGVESFIEEVKSEGELLVTAMTETIALERTRVNVVHVVMKSKLSEEEKQSAVVSVRRFFRGMSEGKIELSKVEEIQTIFSNETKSQSGVVTSIPKQSVSTSTLREHVKKMKNAADLAGVKKLSSGHKTKYTSVNSGIKRNLNYRTWTTKSGSKTKAAFVDYGKAGVRLKSFKSGKMYTVEMSRFSEEDVKYLKNKIYGNQNSPGTREKIDSSLYSPRKWTNQKGKKITARLIDLLQNSVRS